MTRHRRTAAALAALLLAPPLSAGTPVQVVALALEGDSVPGVGQITFINNIAVNNQGDWLVEVDTDNADTNADVVLLRGGLADWREGDAVPAPSGATLSSLDSVTLNDLCQSGFNFFLDGTGGTTNDSGVYGYFDPGSQPFDGTVLAMQESNLAPGLSAGTPFIGFFDVKINNGGRLWVVASVDDPNIASSVDRALYIIDTDPDTGGIAGFELVAFEGEALPGQVETVADFGTGPHGTAFNDQGHAIFFVDLTGDTTTDGATYVYDALDRLIVAQEGDPSPAKGRTWLSLGGQRLDLNNNGDHVFTATLSGDTATDSVLVRNGEVFKQEGDPAPGLGPGFLLTTFGSGPLEISDDGRVLWYGDWNDPDLDIDTGLFLDDTLLVQEGVSTVDGVIIDSLRGIEDGYHMSNDGNSVIFEATLLDGREGAFRITLGAACPWDCGDGDGSAGINDLLALLAQWGGAGPCDFDGGGAGIADLLKLLANWGACG